MFKCNIEQIYIWCIQIAKAYIEFLHSSWMVSSSHPNCVILVCDLDPQRLGRGTEREANNTWHAVVFILCSVGLFCGLRKCLLWPIQLFSSKKGWIPLIHSQLYLNDSIPCHSAKALINNLLRWIRKKDDVKLVRSQVLSGAARQDHATNEK